MKWTLRGMQHLWKLRFEPIVWICEWWELYTCTNYLQLYNYINYLQLYSNTIHSIIVYAQHTQMHAIYYRKYMVMFIISIQLSWQMIILLHHLVVFNFSYDMPHIKISNTIIPASMNNNVSIFSTMPLPRRTTYNTCTCRMAYYHIQRIGRTTNHPDHSITNITLYPFRQCGLTSITKSYLLCFT